MTIGGSKQRSGSTEQLVRTPKTKAYTECQAYRFVMWETLLRLFLPLVGLGGNGVAAFALSWVLICTLVWE